MLIPLGMAEWCIPFWVTFTVTLTSGLIYRFFRVWSISLILHLTFLECVLCKTHSFGGIRHGTVTFLVQNQFYFKKTFQEYYKSIKQFGSRSGPNILSGRIWVQTVCRVYQQMTPVGEEASFTQKEQCFIFLNYLLYFYR